jgi:serine protease Do
MTSRKSTFFYGLLIALSSVVVGMIIASRLDMAPLSSAADLQIPETNSAPITGPLNADTFRNIAKQAGPAVVSIITTTQRNVPRGGLGDLFEQFGLPPGVLPEGEGQPTPAQGEGSGFIIDEQGFILTNNHVVADAQSIEVRLSTMSDASYGLPAKIIGRDELTDIALIQLTELPSGGLPVSKFGDSEQIAPGDWVMAVGNPFGLSNSVTVGIVSAVGRENYVARGRTEAFIQTDAAINRGNSGGPLLNLRGEVIGINTMILTTSQFNAGNVGVGFAVPINTVRDLLPQLRKGKVTRGRIGVGMHPRPITEEYAKELGLPEAGGAEVVSVEVGGPADEAGVQVGDVIIEFNGRPVRSNSELASVVAGTAPDTTVPMKVVRDRKTVTLNVTVEELNLEAEQQARGGRQAPGENVPTETELGMSLRPLTQALRRQLEVPSGRGGAVVTSVTPFSPAAQAGIFEGDVVLSINGQDVSNVSQVADVLEAMASGQFARLIVWREDDGGRRQEALIRLRKP